MADTILRLPAVKQRTGLGTTSIYDRMGRKEFPQSISLGGKMRGWILAEVDAWIEQRIAESRKAA